MPHVARIVELSNHMIGVMKNHRSAGESEAAEHVLRTGLKVAQHLGGIQDGGNLLGEMVGVVVERRFLQQSDPESAPGFLNGTVQERLGALENREREIRNDSQFFGRWISQAPEAEIVSYFDRLKLYGETAAMEWLRNRNDVR
jgi:hypothetical protein